MTSRAAGRRKLEASDSSGPAPAAVVPRTLGDLPPLGKVLRERRIYHRWTLAQVSEMTGISVSTLSKIENGLMSPTYDKILQLSRGLEVEIADLLGATGVNPGQDARLARCNISRRDDGHVLRTEFYTYRYLCSMVAHKRIVPIHIDVRACTPAEVGELTSHVGEEFVEVLDGRIRLLTEHYEPIDLETGDGVYLDSTMAHAYMSLVPGGSRLLVTCSSATPNLAQTLRELIRQRIGSTDE